MAGAFDATAYDNVGYFSGASVAPPVVVTIPGAGSGGRDPAPISSFIRWGKKKKKDREEQIEEVAAAIQQAVAAEAAPYIDPVNREAIAARLLETETLARLRRIRTIEAMMDRIEREIAEMDDEEAILLLM